LNEVHRKSPSAARPGRQGVGCASVRSCCSACSANLDTGFAEDARTNKIEQFLAAGCHFAGNAGCADLALVYGNGSGLSRFPGAFWVFLVT
jgi:hypothetical protein